MPKLRSLGQIFLSYFYTHDTFLYSTPLLFVFQLRALLTNAFDDLIDEDDILSITSEEGTDSRNVSLIQRASNDSFGRLTGENK